MLLSSIALVTVSGEPFAWATAISSSKPYGTEVYACNVVVDSMTEVKEAKVNGAVSHASSH